MLSCRDGAMQHCQQAPVSNEFSTAVLADSTAVRGGCYLFSHPRIHRGHSLPQHYLIRWTFFPSLTSLVLFITSFKSREHHAEELATCPTQLSLSALFLCINTTGSSFIKTGVQMGHGCSHAEDTSPPDPHHTPSFCRCLIVAGLSCTVITVPPAQQGCLPPALVALTSVWLYF